MRRLLVFVIAIALVLGLVEWYRHHRHVAAAHIAEGMALAVGVKNRVAHYYYENGKLPSSNKEMELPEPGQFAGESLTSLAVTDGGVITITFNALSGADGGVIRLKPDTSVAAVGIRWQCETSSYENIETWMPQCKYVQ